MKVLLVGLGRMGKRYQSVLQAKYTDSLDLYIVDPLVPQEDKTRQFADITAVPDTVAFDLAIDARPNVDRLGMLKHFLVRGIPNILIEKPTATSLRESEMMLELQISSPHPPR